MPTYIGDKNPSVFFEDRPMNKIWVGVSQVYPSGGAVTYHVDTNVTYKEDVENGASCLSPKTFTPTKSGWSFVGWKLNTTADNSVLKTLTMEDQNIDLYAVFQQSVVVTYYNGNTTKQSTSGIKYYNNGTTVNPKFTITQATLSGWTTRGWSTSTAGNGAITYKTISNTEIASSVTLYGMYQLTITLTLYNGSATPTKPTGIRYYNPGSGNVVNPTFTVAAAGISGWTFRGWSTSSAGNGNINYTAINNTAFAANATLYGLYQRTLTLSYNANGGGGTTSAQTGTQYYSSAGTFIYPSFTLRANGFSASGYTFVQWRYNSPSGAAYAPGAVITLGENATMYAEWRVYVSYYAVYNTVQLTSGIAWQYLGNSDYRMIPDTSYLRDTWQYGREPAFMVQQQSSIIPSGAWFNMSTNSIPANGCSFIRISMAYNQNNLNFFNYFSVSINVAGVSQTLTSYGYLDFSIPSAYWNTNVPITVTITTKADIRGNQSIPTGIVDSILLW